MGREMASLLLLAMLALTAAACAAADEEPEPSGSLTVDAIAHEGDGRLLGQVVTLEGRVQETVGDSLFLIDGGLLVRSERVLAGGASLETGTIVRIVGIVRSYRPGAIAGDIGAAREGFAYDAGAYVDAQSVMVVPPPASTRV